MPKDEENKFDNGYFRGKTEVSIAGIAKGVDELHDEISAMPCGRHSTTLTSLKVQGYARWFLILMTLGAIGWVYKQIPELTAQVSALTTQVSSLTTQLTELAHRINP